MPHVRTAQHQAHLQRPWVTFGCPCIANVLRTSPVGPWRCRETREIGVGLHCSTVPLGLWQVLQKSLKAGLAKKALSGQPLPHTSSPKDSKRLKVKMDEVWGDLSSPRLCILYLYIYNFIYIYILHISLIIYHNTYMI